MKKNKILAGLLSFMMILSSLSVFPVSVSAAAVGDTVTEAELMTGLGSEPVAEANFNENYDMSAYANRAEIMQDGTVSYLHQNAAGLETIGLKDDNGAALSRAEGSLTKIKFRYAHNTQNASWDDMIIFDGGMLDGYRARFALRLTEDGKQQFFVLRDKDGARTWEGLDLPENGYLAPNTWHELAISYDAAHDLTVWAQVGCTGDYVMLTSFKLWKENYASEVRIGYSGAKTGANSVCDVDYIKVYQAAEAITAESLLEGCSPLMQKEFKTAQDAQGGTIISATEKTSAITADGLTLRADAAFTDDRNNAKWKISDDAITFSGKAAMHLRFTETSDSGGAAVYFEIACGDGLRRRFGFSRTLFNYAEKDAWPSVATDVMTKGNPVELIVRNTEDNQLEFWIMNTTGSWGRIATTSGLRAGSTAKEVLIGTQSGAEANIEFFRMYGERTEPGDDKETKTETELIGTRKTKHALEFADDMGKGTVSGGTHSVANGMLNLSGGADYTNTTFTYDVGDVAHFRFTKTSTGASFPIFELNTNDGRMRFHPEPGSIRYTRALMDGDPENYVTAGGGYSTWQGITTEPNVTYDYLIINKEAGYEFWRKAGGDDEYTYIGITEGKYQWKETKLRILANGDSSVAVDFVRVYSVNDPEKPDPDDPEGEDADIITGGGQVWLYDDFSDPQNSKAKLEDAQITDGTANIRPGTDHRDNGATNFARVTFELGDYGLNGEWIMTMRMKLNATFWQANIGFGGTRSMIHINQSSVKVNSKDVFNVPREMGVYYDYVYYVKNNLTASLYQCKVGTNTWQTVFENQTLTAWGSNKIEMNSNNTQTSWDVDEIKVYSGTLLDFDAEGLGTAQVSAKGSVFQGVPNSADKQLSVILATYDKEHGYTTSVEEVKKTVPGYKETSLDTDFDLGSLDLSKNDTAVMLWNAAKVGYPLINAKGYTTPNTAAGAPERNQEIGLTGTPHYNEVLICGYAGAVDTVAATLTDQNGEIKAISQIKTNDYGMADSKIAVDPTLPNGEYVLYLQYGNRRESVKVNLYGAEILTEGAIDSAAAFAEIIQKYGSETEKAAMEDAEFAEAAYARYVSQVGEDGTDDLYVFQNAAAKAIADETTDRKLIEEMNTAAAAKRWSVIETILTKTYADYLGITSDTVSGIQNTKELYLRMTGTVYHNAEEILTRLESAVAAQKKAEQEAGGGNGGGGSSGGGGSFGGGGSNGYGGGVAISDKPQTVTPTPVTAADGQDGSGADAFADLEGVSWAEESIGRMSQMGFVSGNGDGTFAPNRAVSREEFLKIVMLAAGIEIEVGEGVQFVDTDKDAWYYPYVASAYRAGIVKGVSEERFGIGESITRADMAVMLCRALAAAGAELPPKKAAFVFADFSQIPDYAAESIDRLCEASLMQGVGNQNFAPMASATRAEAAVAVYRVYQYLHETAKGA